MRITNVECDASIYGKVTMKEHYENVKSAADFEQRVIDIMFIHGCSVDICYDRTAATVILKYDVKHIEL